MIDGRRFILGVEAGNEIMDGEGTFTYDEYSLTVS